jgi:hypothetical protein
VPFPAGSIVELLEGSFLSALPGARAKVREPVRNEDPSRYVYVVWIRDDKSLNQADGGYYPSDFVLVQDGNSPAPRNNDGRSECFWCPGTRTEKRGGGCYDVCPGCGR